MPNYPNDQGKPGGAIPVYVTADPSSAGITPLGYQQLTGMTTATPLTVPAGATVAVIQAEAQSVRYRDDVVAPTASVGMLLTVANGPYTYSGPLASVEFIAATAGAILNVSYYS